MIPHRHNQPGFFTKEPQTERPPISDFAQLVLPPPVFGFAVRGWQPT